MIIWLASYPKSGNTWVRYFLTSLLLKNNYSDLRKLQFIGQYPKRSHFKNLVTDFSNFENISKNWIKSQDEINKDKKLKFLKTHHALCNLNGSFFTNYNNTLGAIYIVRDPRNVLISILNHFSKKNYDDAKNFLIDENRVIGSNQANKDKTEFDDNEITTVISSWKAHYKSWKLLNKNFLLVKYENLIKNPDDEFFKIFDYVKKFIKIDNSKNLVKNAIKESSFENLKEKEKKFGFNEAPIDPETGEKKKFFNLGPTSSWQGIVDERIINEINEKFETEMRELGYL